MKRVFVLSASYGEGHNAAARGLVEAINNQAGGEAAQLLDLLALSIPRRDRWSRRGYAIAINRFPRMWSALYCWLDRAQPFPRHLWVFRKQEELLEQLIMDERPQVICSTHPIFAFMVSRIVTRRKISLLSYNIVTDSISINSMWWLSQCDGWFVPNEESAEVMRQAGCEEGRLHVTGFPVGAAFASDSDHRYLLDLRSGEMPRVLYIINSTSGLAEATAAALLAQRGWELTIAVGKNDALRRRIEKLAFGRTERTQVLGWSDRMPQLLMAHHVVVSKAGGATTQEAISAHCPMIVNQVIPGQEEGNCELLRRHGIGARAETPGRVVKVLQQAFSANGALWRQWYRQTVRLARPEAAKTIAAFVLNKAEGGRAISLKTLPPTTNPRFSHA
jgi:processive 1,2-diacylglycerol beta-glucosyltransferase